MAARLRGVVVLCWLVVLVPGCETSSQLEPEKPLVELVPDARLQLCRFTVDLLGPASFEACGDAPIWTDDFDACVADVPWDGCGDDRTVADWEACVLALNADACSDPAPCARVLCPAP